MEFRKLNILVGRNIRLYFKDKALFLVSLITPLILVVLFLTFLGQVYTDSLMSIAPEGVNLSRRLVKGFTGGWLFSSILATSSVTVAFCSNVMVNDKINHAVDDFNLTPVRRSTVGFSYLIANFCTTLIVCLVALLVGMLYLAIVGWYLSLVDVLMIVLVVTINTLFGTLLASMIGLFINTQGALSGVCTMVSSLYGFICGAYMPLSQFAPGLRVVLGFLPGTHSTILLRHYFMRGTVDALGKDLGSELVTEVENSFDGRLIMFGNPVPVWLQFVIVGAVITLLAVGFVILMRHRSAPKKGR